MLSHEFRTSLAIISGAVTNLRSIPNKNDAISKRYDRIDRANERLIQLTDNCLSDDRISSDNQELLISEENLINIIKKVKKIVDISDNNDIHFRLNGNSIEFENLPTIYIKADAAMLQIAISNVLGNALKYMDNGNIYFELITSKNSNILRIEDNGPGINTEHVNVIFDRYKRVVDTKVPGGEKSGFGLGLYITKEIMNAHGGDIKLIKNSKNGCCFELTIPNNVKKERLSNGR